VLRATTIIDGRRDAVDVLVVVT